MAVELERRAFGELLETRISEMVEPLLTVVDLRDVYRKTEAILRLADWLSTAEGYGNILLAERCRDVATVGIARLVADLDYPIKNVTNLLAALHPTPSAVRAQTLNLEAGAPLFPDEATQEDLEMIWRSGALIALEARNPQLKGAGLRNPKLSTIDTRLIRENLAFFQDDELPALPTTARTWNQKRHERLVVGFESSALRKLIALATFREKVGNFPLRPTYPEHQFESDGKAAFDEAWRPYATPETHALYALAWLAYDEISKGKFLDQDTLLNTGAR